MRIIHEGLPDKTEAVGHLVVLDKEGRGVLYVLTRDHYLLAFPGKQTMCGFVFTNIGYSFTLTAEEAAAVHPTSVHPTAVDWDAGLLHDVVIREAGRMAAARMN